MTKTIDWLVVTEKADQARRFKKALQLDNQKSILLDGVVEIVHARGRLYDFAVPDEQNESRYGRKKDKIKSSNVFSVSNDVEYRSDKDRLDNMPTLLNSRPDGKIIYEPIDANAGQIADEIASKMLSSKHIIIATDWDVEGELIFNDIVTVHNLASKLDWNNVYRIHINGLDDMSISDALKNLEVYGSPTGVNIPDIQRMVSQGYARSIVDYEFGYTFSFYNEMLKRQLDLQFVGGLGRLKLSVLNAVLDQENKYETKDIRKKYGLKINLPNEFEVEIPTVYYSRQDAEIEAAHLPKKVDIEVRTGHKNIMAPELFTRTSYIITMDHDHDSVDWGRPLQSAYETYASVSYPRTGSSYVNMRLFAKLRDLVESQNVQELLAHRVLERGYDALAFDKLKPRHKYVDDELASEAAHQPIVPTRVLDALDFDRMDAHGDFRAKEAYLEVLYHTMAMFAENGVDEGQLIKIYDDHDDVIVSKVFQKVRELGWRKLINGDTPSDVFYEGSSEDGVEVTYDVIDLPPVNIQLFDHASLLKYLNENNIGTESTREPVISELIHINMINKDENGSYRINESIAKILQVIRVENWVDISKLQHWDSELSLIKDMRDAMKFIQQRRNELIELNEKVKSWYMSNQL